MTTAFWVLGAVAVWTAGLGDWIVAYATGVAQLGVWLTLLSLVPMASLWVNLKRQPFQDVSPTTARAHWSLQIKASVKTEDCFDTLNDCINVLMIQYQIET
jgi:hypothetical protein